MEPLAYRSRVGRWLPAAERVSEVVASIDALIMDFDGLMIDSEYQIAMATLEILSRRGADLTMDEIGHLFGPVDNEHEWESLMQRLFAGSFTVADLDAALAVLLTPDFDELPLLPGVIDLLDAAGACGWRLGLATGQRPARLEVHLRRLGLADRFDAVVTSSEVEHGKPAPDIYREVAHRLHVLPGSCLVVEDSLPGCQAALAAGTSVIICPSRVSAGCDFPEAITLVSSLTEVGLKAWVRGVGAVEERIRHHLT